MPVRLILRLLKVATPLTAATVVVPLSVPLPGLVPIATVTDALLLVTVLPKVSRTVTRTAGVMLTPATVLLGDVVKASAAAAPGEILNAALVAPVEPRRWRQ